MEASTDPATTGQFCLTGTGLASDPCYPTKKEADAALAGIGTATTQTWCLQGQDDATLKSDLGAACLPTKEEAQAVLDAIQLKASDSQFCVVSSAGVNLGCFLSRELAQAKLQETGQERLLQVIGTTARLEQRAVLATLTPTSPDYASTPVTCDTSTAKESPDCTFDALKDQDVVFRGRDGQTKDKLIKHNYTILS